jgi:Uma2 family endonuclease
MLNQRDMLSHMRTDVERRRFNVDEYYAMADAGILSRTDRVELVDGEIVAMTPIGPVHASVVDRAASALMRAAGEQAIVRVQNPIRLDTFDEPQPDLAVLRLPGDTYRKAHPQPPDILLVVEVADHSLRYDRDVQGPLYARSGIIEYWLVDLASRTVSCYTSPEGGVYRDVTFSRGGESITPAALPGCIVSVDDLL